MSLLELAHVLREKRAHESFYFLFHSHLHPLFDMFNTLKLTFFSFLASWQLNSTFLLFFLCNFKIEQFLLTLFFVYMYLYVGNQMSSLGQVTFIMCLCWNKCERVMKVRNRVIKNCLIYKCITFGALYNGIYWTKNLYI